MALDVAVGGRVLGGLVQRLGGVRLDVRLVLVEIGQRVEVVHHLVIQDVVTRVFFPPEREPRPPELWGIMAS